MYSEKYNKSKAAGGKRRQKQSNANRKKYQKSELTDREKSGKPRTVSRKRPREADWKRRRRIQVRKQRAELCAAIFCLVLVLALRNTYGSHQDSSVSGKSSGMQTDFTEDTAAGDVSTEENGTAEDADSPSGLESAAASTQRELAGLKSTAIETTEAEDAEQEYTEIDLLILVNKDNPLPDDYEPELCLLANGYTAVAAVMYDALMEMLSDGTAAGLEFVVASGYRSSERQEELLEADIQTDMELYGMSWEEAYEKETLQTMPAGYSEHATGLAVDIVSMSYQLLDEKQAETAEIQWLQANCSNYGFILRYPEGKEDITGIDYESWHFRYVGYEAAQEITERGITLEEYLEEAE